MVWFVELTTRKSKRDWLEAALETLADVGADHMTIESLTNRLGVTKGSFYHHFGSYQGFKTALLEFYETEGTSQVIDYSERGDSPADKLKRLLKITTDYPPNTETAIRAWSLHDEEVRVYQERIDERRIAYVRELIERIAGDSEKSLRIARTLYALLIGAYHVTPLFDRKIMGDLFAEFLRLYRIE
jgi:AcrR family transcriptional regulator